MITRKKFLALSSLGAVSLLFPTYLFSKDKSIPVSADVNTLLKNAKDLRSKGKNNEAKQIYQQIILQYPNDIRGYDGMRKAILSQKKKEWEVILMFKAALALNPDSAELKQRLYKEYLNAALGNKRIKNTINFNGRLLADVKQKYENLAQNQPGNKSLNKQYSKICRLLDYNADSQKANKNSALKKYRKTSLKNYKKRFDTITTAQLETKLASLEAKPKSNDRKQHIREINHLIVKRYRKDKNNTAALNRALSYYNNFDKADPLFLKYIRDLAKLQKNHSVLISVETQNHASKKSFWSALALLDAYIRKAEQTSTSVPADASQTILFLEANAFTPQMIFEVTTRKIKMDLLAGRNENAKNRILEQCQNMFGIVNPHYIDRINVLTAVYYKKTNNAGGAKKIVDIAIHPDSFVQDTDPIIKSLAHMNLKRSMSKPIHIQNLNKLLQKI
ncbi:tetratricopeptide repeat protein [Chryseobacterium sp. MIQD13]|uniref:tetratricopeptide repeat protein n=1 Tax=Chryseobacterium sp. MIQD13 TaxID=3422310 RepID=UPI003D2CAAAC